MQQQRTAGLEAGSIITATPAHYAGSKKWALRYEVVEPRATKGGKFSFLGRRLSGSKRTDSEPREYVVRANSIRVAEEQGS
ncbi:MAG: hypothetical protein ACJ760_14080 [Thermoleophilaceae bacterium]